LDIDDSDVRLTPAIHPSNNPHIVPEITTATQTLFSSQNNQVAKCVVKPIRIIPGYAGIVQTAKLRKLVDTRESEEGSVMSTQEYIRKLLRMWNGKLEKIVVVIKSCTLNALGDLTVTLKDLSGIISGTIHYKVLTEERFAKVFTVGSDLMLYNVSVLSPKQSTHHYLNITKKNMVKVFHKDDGST
ncbi:hypothetical protein Tco_1373823, partial [Tanacetum coccineum]